MVLKRYAIMPKSNVALSLSRYNTSGADLCWLESPCTYLGTAAESLVVTPYIHEIDYKTHLRKGVSYVEYLDVDRHMRDTFMA
jgi:hypothetical protein